MNDIFENAIFKRSMRELNIISKDKSRNECMTKCSRKVVDFDKVKELYVRKKFNEIKKLYDKAEHKNLINGFVKSVDALVYLEDSNRFAIVEFKNGKLDFNDIGQEICDKITDSLFIINDILGKNIFYTRHRFEFILVYNQKNNDYLEVNLEEEAKRLNFIRFKNKYLIDVNMLTIDMFDKLLKKNKLL